MAGDGPYAKATTDQFADDGAADGSGTHDDVKIRLGHSQALLFRQMSTMFTSVA
jgi:hypothetical protein